MHYRGGKSISSTMTLRSLVPFAVLAATLAACGDFPLAPGPIVRPELPAGTESLMPLATYADWWRSTENCAGRRGDMSRISWFVVPNHTSFVYANAQYNGYWWNGVHWILLAGEKVTNASIVRHEMLHELLGRGDHPPEFFQVRCAALVTCEGLCRSGD
jgi:hypothetical protein